MAENKYKQWQKKIQDGIFLNKTQFPLLSTLPFFFNNLQNQQVAWRLYANYKRG